MMQMNLYTLYLLLYTKENKDIQVVIATGPHLFPFRTEKLSPLAPMVLRNSGRVGRRQLLERAIEFSFGCSFCVYGRC